MQRLIKLALATALVACAPAPSSLRAPSAEAGGSLFAPGWRFTDEHGAAVSLDAYGGKPLVVAMFFRTCTMRCPRTVSKMLEIQAAFARRGESPDFVLVTLDPVNDTPARLLDYKEKRKLPEGSWHVLSGDISTTRAIADYLAVRPAYDDGHIDHDVRIVVFDERGAPVRRFHGWSFDAEVATR